MSLEAVRRLLERRRPAAVRRSGCAEAAVALVLVPGARGVEGLFIRRARHPADPWSGQIGLPGGRREKSDAGLFETALRETREETGVLLGRRAFLGRLDDLHPRSRSLPDIVVRPFVFALDARPAVVPSPEVAYPLWLPLGALREGRGVARPVSRGRRLAVPCARAGRHMVWGMTHRIIGPLLEESL